MKKKFYVHTILAYNKDHTTAHSYFYPTIKQSHPPTVLHTPHNCANRIIIIFNERPIISDKFCVTPVCYRENTLKRFTPSSTRSRKKVLSNRRSKSVAECDESEIGDFSERPPNPSSQPPSRAETQTKE